MLGQMLLSVIFFLTIAKASAHDRRHHIELALHDPTDLEVRRNMAITQSLLWIAKPEEIPLLKRTKE
jgi:hypothetical protein